MSLRMNQSRRIERNRKKTVITAEELMELKKTFLKSKNKTKDDKVDTTVKCL